MVNSKKGTRVVCQVPFEIEHETLIKLPYTYYQEFFTVPTKRTVHNSKKEFLISVNICNEWQWCAKMNMYNVQTLDKQLLLCLSILICQITFFLHLRNILAYLIPFYLNPFHGKMILNSTQTKMRIWRGRNRFWQTYSFHDSLVCNAHSSRADFQEFSLTPNCWHCSFPKINTDTRVYVCAKNCLFRLCIKYCIKMLACKFMHFSSAKLVSSMKNIRNIFWQDIFFRYTWI